MVKILFLCIESNLIGVRFAHDSLLKQFRKNKKQCFDATYKLNIRGFSAIVLGFLENTPMEFIYKKKFSIFINKTKIYIVQDKLDVFDKLYANNKTVLKISGYQGKLVNLEYYPYILLGNKPWAYFQETPVVDISYTNRKSYCKAIFIAEFYASFDFISFYNGFKYWKNTVCTYFYIAKKL